MVGRLASLRDWYKDTGPPFAGITAVGWTSAELAYSLIAATIPGLLALMSEFNTGFGVMYGRDDIQLNQVTPQKPKGSSDRLGRESREGTIQNRSSIEVGRPIVLNFAAVSSADL